MPVLTPIGSFGNNGKALALNMRITLRILLIEPSLISLVFDCSKTRLIDKQDETHGELLAQVKDSTHQMLAMSESKFPNNGLSVLKNTLQEMETRFTKEDFLFFT
jgi:hypothetical protein